MLHLSAPAQQDISAVDNARARQVAEIQSLSEEEAEALLLKEISSGGENASS